MEAVQLRILPINPSVDIAIRTKIVSNLKELVARATYIDACKHDIRLFLDAILDDSWFSSARCFVALEESPQFTVLEGVGIARGFLIAYEDTVKDDVMLDVTSIVAPSHRRKGIFRSLVAALKASYLPGNPPGLLFEFCEQSKSGMACANAMRLSRVQGCDLYLECTKLKPPASSLPSIALKSGSLTDVDDILKIWSSDHTDEDEADERRILLRDLQDNLRCWLLYIDGAPVASVTYVVSEVDVYLMNVIVVPSARCKGYGEAMVREAVRHSLEDLGKPRVCLETTKDNALRMYLRVGFEVVYSWTSWREAASP